MAAQPSIGDAFVIESSSPRHGAPISSATRRAIAAVTQNRP